MTFKPKSVIWMYKEHFRPRIVMLNATPGLDIPGEYSLYLDNMYYTEYIGKELKHARYNSTETVMTSCAKSYQTFLGYTFIY